MPKRRKTSRLEQKVLNSFLVTPFFIDFTQWLYLALTFLDIVTTRFGVSAGVGYETNFLYFVMGDLYFTFYWVISFALLFGLRWFCQKFFYSVLLLWIPNGVHLVCLAHNLTLLLA